MRCFRSLLILAVVSLPEAQALAQSNRLPPKPYPAVTITPANLSNDVTLAAFRLEIAVVAKSRIYSALARMMVARGFFWDRDFGHGFDPRKPAVDNLATALALEHDGGTGWQLLAAFAAEPTVEPLESRDGVLCAPSRPGYDGVAYTRLLDTTYTTDRDWAYPRAAETPLRTAPQVEAALLSTLGAHFVRLLDILRGEDEPSHPQWAKVVTPDGKVGFVAPGSLMSLSAARLCYVKDGFDGWRIAGYVARGN
jgi:hypothetical protein